MSTIKDKPLFSDTLSDLNWGGLDMELGEKLHELVDKCQSTQRSGKIQLTLTVKPSGQGRIMINDDVKLTLPKEERGSSVMFVMPSGALTRKDPRQMEIEGLRSVEHDTSEAKRLPEAEARPLRRVN